MSKTPIVSIKLGKTRSKMYNDAVSKIQCIDNCECVDGIYHADIYEPVDFIKHVPDILFLINTVYGWKAAEVLFYGNKYIGANDFHNFMLRLENEAGEYAPLVRSSYSCIAMHSITMENLPLPIVHYPGIYGAFFAFSENVNGEIYFCECERKAIENYINLRKQKPLTNYVGYKTYPLGGDFFPEKISEKSRMWKDNPLNHVKFKEKICFACNGAIPKLLYCDPMYGDTFQQKYGWYKIQEMLRMGIDPRMIGSKNLIEDVNILKDECPTNLYDDFLRISELQNISSTRRLAENEQEEESLLYGEFLGVINNKVRERFGYKAVGESWVSATMMFQIVESIFKGFRTVRHYRANWLEGLELDIYVPDKKIAFEYQGIQHFKAVEHWSGEEQLKKQQEHDKRKKAICDNKGVDLIYINYDEDLSENLLRAKLKWCTNHFEKENI